MYILSFYNAFELNDVIEISYGAQNNDNYKFLIQLDNRTPVGSYYIGMQFGSIGTDAFGDNTPFEFAISITLNVIAQFEPSFVGLTGTWHLK